MGLTWARERRGERDATVTTHAAAAAAALLASSATAVLFATLRVRARVKRRREPDGDDSLGPQRRAEIEQFVR